LRRYILLTEFMQPMKLSQNGLARGIDVPPRRINEIVQGKRAITAETALKLSRAFGLSETFWVNMQAHYDAELAKDKLGEKLRRIPRIASPAARVAKPQAPRLRRVATPVRQGTPVKGVGGLVGGRKAAPKRAAAATARKGTVAAKKTGTTSRGRLPKYK
jgi:antitoxin HigA-1